MGNSPKVLIAKFLGMMDSFDLLEYASLAASRNLFAAITSLSELYF